MKIEKIPPRRLLHQHISRASFSGPGDLVAWMGAMQAQDYSGAKWAIGLRLQKGKEATVEQAIAERSIVRSWLFRGTLHFVAGKDLCWMRAMVAGRLIAGSAKRRRDLELDDKTLAKCAKIFTKALGQGKQLMRDELYRLLEAGGIRVDTQRGYHILWKLAMDGLICFGSHQGKQPAFALADGWLPEVKSRTRDESLAALAQRYFCSHGPATLKDFIWWSGLLATEARAGLEAVVSNLHREVIEGEVYWMAKESSSVRTKGPRALLLPGFDEYLLGYTDRSAVLAAEYFQKIVPGNNGMFLPMMVRKGKVVGTWKKEIRKQKVILTLVPFEAGISPAAKEWLSAGQGYGKFLGLPIELSNA